MTDRAPRHAAPLTRDAIGAAFEAHRCDEHSGDAWPAGCRTCIRYAIAEWAAAAPPLPTEGTW
jgi:hypothetical protein